MTRAVLLIAIEDRGRKGERARQVREAYVKQRGDKTHDVGLKARASATDLRKGFRWLLERVDKGETPVVLLSSAWRHGGDGEVVLQVRRQVVSMDEVTRPFFDRAVRRRHARVAPGRVDELWRMGLHRRRTRFAASQHVAGVQLGRVGKFATQTWAGSSLLTALVQHRTGGFAAAYLERRRRAWLAATLAAGAHAADMVLHLMPDPRTHSSRFRDVLDGKVPVPNEVGTNGEVDPEAGSTPYRPPVYDAGGALQQPEVLLDWLRVYGVFDFAGGHLGSFVMVVADPPPGAPNDHGFLQGKEYWPFATVHDLPGSFILSPLLDLALGEDEIDPADAFVESGPISDFATSGTVWPAQASRVWRIWRAAVVNPGPGDTLNWHAMEAYLVLDSADAFTWFGQPGELENDLLPSGVPLLFLDTGSTAAPAPDMSAFQSVDP